MTTVKTVNNPLHIIMYHYVRNTSSRFPTLKMRKRNDFIRQLNFLQERFAIISASQLIDHVRGAARLPANPCLLTFDDGYQEHFTEVFPELYRRKISGAFFPPVSALRRNCLLNVNKIQLLLALNEGGLEAIIRRIKTLYEDERRNNTPGFEPTFSDLWQKLATPGMYDGKETMFIKRILQFGLPSTVRKYFVEHLFAEFVSIDERVIANEYYMSEEMLRVMAQNGMHIGSHGDAHVWLDKLTPRKQEAELGAALDMLERVYGNAAARHNWIISYPFGGVSESLRDLCKHMGCVLGFITENRIARIGTDDPLRLPKRDTNDYPCPNSMASYEKGHD